MSSQSIARAVLAGSDGSTLSCQFNPQTVKLSRKSNWKTQPGKGSPKQPKPQFTGTDPETLEAQLLFDCFDSLGGAQQPVEEAVQRIMAWTCVPEHAYSAGTPQPPTVTFSWGTGLTFPGYVTDLSVNYLMFDTDGTPLRATIDVKMQKVPDDQPATNPTSGGIIGRRCAQIGDGDTLSSVAQREYGDPNLWRALAAANGVEDPTRLPVGARLLVPPRTQAADLVAEGRAA
jgi:hypothetical protein